MSASLHNLCMSLLSPNLPGKINTLNWGAPNEDEYHTNTRIVDVWIYAVVTQHQLYLLVTQPWNDSYYMYNKMSKEMYIALLKRKN